MEVVVPAPEFHFHTAVDTTHITPSSSPPNHFNDNSSFFEFHHHRHVSAPSSPTYSAAIYAAYRKTAIRGSRRLSVPFDWEEKPGTPKSASFDEKDADFGLDFSFAFSDRSIDKVAQPPPASPGETASMVPADELFELGKIRPLKLPPRFYAPVMGEQGPKSPRSVGLLSPLRRGRNRRSKELDPFVLAMVEATRSRRVSRSLSPFGGRGKGGSCQTPASSQATNPPPIAEKSWRGWKSWLKEMLLFRSPSEGRVREERKNNDFPKYGSSSSSSSGSSNSSVGSAKVKTEFCVVAGGGGFRSEENESKCREAVAPQESMESRMVVAMEKKTVVPYKRSMFIVRSFNAGKFAASFIRRRT